MKEFYTPHSSIYTYFWRFHQNSVIEKSGLILMKLQGKGSQCLAKHHSACSNPRISGKELFEAHLTKFVTGRFSSLMHFQCK